MNRIVKSATTATLTGALALASAMPSQAHDGRWGAAAVGFGAGALVGAAAASTAYNNGYYYGADYYEPGYAYAPGYDSYAYEPGYAYVPAPSYGYYYGSRWGDEYNTNNFSIDSQR